jgi:hypothetical protein
MPYKTPYDGSSIRDLVKMRDESRPATSDELPPMSELNREVSPFGGVNPTEEERKQRSQQKREARQRLNVQARPPIKSTPVDIN